MDLIFYGSPCHPNVVGSDRLSRGISQSAYKLTPTLTNIIDLPTLSMIFQTINFHP